MHFKHTCAETSIRNGDKHIGNGNIKKSLKSKFYQQNASCYLLQKRQIKRLNFNYTSVNTRVLDILT